MTLSGWSSVAPAIRRGIERIPWKPLLRFGIPIAIAGIGGQALLLADRYLIAALRGDAEVGLYTPSYSIATRVIGLIFAPAFGALYPIIARLWAERATDDGLRLIETVHRAFVIAAGFAVLIFVFFHEPIASLTMGARFRAGSIVMAIVAPASYFWFVGILFHQVFEQAERTREITAMVGGAALLNAGLNLVFVPRYGYVAAAWTTLFCYLLYMVVAYLWSSSRLHMQSRIPWSSYGRLLLMTVLLVAWRSTMSGPPPLWLGLGASAVGFAVILVVTKEPLLRGWRQLLELRKGTSGSPPAVSSMERD
jgi:O-antigen/teichoic acid export membrane protein